ncbi:hypothetical protein EGD00_14625 [Pectobacterium carotovorum subsp. carotovorum]|nr:hypothetical protein EGD00_14625 [Pectobacterium carotovorum subsp. carotovorum]
MILLNVSGGAGDGYLSLNGNNNSSVKLDIWGSQRVRGDLTLSGSNDGKTTGAISASGNITGKYLQPASISIAGEVCSPDGLISRDETGDIVLPEWGMERNRWREYHRTATDSLRFQSTGDFNYQCFCSVKILSGRWYTHRFSHV